MAKGPRGRDVTPASYLTSFSSIIGWDIGGAHVKASLGSAGRVHGVMQVAAPLWRGLNHLDEAIAAVRARWPEFQAARHAVTMTAEMVDLFDDRRAGVSALAAHLRARLSGDLHFYAGSAGWVASTDASRFWSHIASANWLATANFVAQHRAQAVLIDIGSTTTDLIPIHAGTVCARGRTDAERLVNGELVYLGVVRTPLCALAAQIHCAGELHNVMNEFFATSADVFRLTGELDGAHDQYPPADDREKDLVATRRRLARMVGRDVRDAPESVWLELALAWRDAMLGELDRNLVRVLNRTDTADGVALVGAGSGAFLAAQLAARHGLPFCRFSQLVDAPGVDAAALETCAPSVAVALLATRACT
jgi:(4-(4-[2-(gamma-L-glutamylamino)ethyl]phenoxymethyl)furan-2-yl)methanamine synthase